MRRDSVGQVRWDATQAEQHIDSYRWGLFDMKAMVSVKNSVGMMRNVTEEYSIDVVLLWCSNFGSRSKQRQGTNAS